MPKGSPVPGSFRGTLTPYVIPICEAAEDPDTRWIVAVMGSQDGKTEICLNLIGKNFDDNPRPTLYVGPTQKNVCEKIEPRIMSMIRSSKSLRSKFAGGQKSGKTKKLISGVALHLGWAGSATELASVSAALALIDELDRMKDVPGEGSVIGQVKARLQNYLRSLGVINSTATVGNVETYVDEHGFERWKVAKPEDIESPTWQQWQEGSREEFAVPCPHCEGWFIPRLSLMTWKTGGTLEEVRSTAALGCFRCGSTIDDSHRREMTDRGVYLGPGQYIEDGEKKGDLINRYKRSFWKSGLMNKIVSWGERCSVYVEAARSKDQGRIQTAKNLEFAELYALRGDAPEWDAVRECAGDYETGVAPTGVQYIYATVDVQENRLVYVIRGWGYAYESWGIEAKEIYATTSTSDPQDACWAELTKVLDRSFDGKAIRLMAVDGGYNTEAVQAFAKLHIGRVRVTFGRDNRTSMFSVSNVEVNRNGKKIRTGLQNWTVDHGHFKQWVYERMARPQDAAGSWHIAKDMDAPGAGEPSERYCKEVTAETRMRFASGRVVWKKIRSDNHYLDCEYLQAFLAESDGVRNLRPIDETDEPPPKAPKKAANPWLKTQSNWL